MLAKIAKTILWSKQLVIFIFYRGIRGGNNTHNTHLFAVE